MTEARRKIKKRVFYTVIGQFRKLGSHGIYSLDGFII